MIDKDALVKAWIIYLDDEIILSRHDYENWFEIEEEFGDRFKTNRPVTDLSRMRNYFLTDLGEDADMPFTEEEIAAFFDGEEETISAKR